VAVTRRPDAGNGAAWISGTSDNSILSLIFGYNGLGRVTGQSGGPGGAGGAGGAFGQGTGPLRLLNAALGGQDGWLLAWRSSVPWWWRWRAGRAGAIREPPGW